MVSKVKFSYRSFGELVPASEEMDGIGVDKDGVVMQLAGVVTACWVVVERELMTAGWFVAVWRVGDSAGMATAARVEMGEELRGEGMQLDTAWLDVVLVDPGLDTAMDVVVVVMVHMVVGGWLELDVAELASALLRAWYSAARFLSFRILL